MDPMTLGKSERYAAWLLHNLPRLKEKAIHGPDSPRITRTTVLPETIKLIENRPGSSLEFGVWRGKSINLCADLYPDRQWYGFDSFEGFPEDGRIDWQKSFKVVELPEVPDNVTLVQGYFSDTLDGFLASHDQPIAFVNVDCDIYSSTVDIFTALEKHGHMQPGLPIFFDELINYVDALWNEMLALFEMLERTGLGFEWHRLDKNLWLARESLELIEKDTFPVWREQMAGSYWQQASIVLTDAGVDYGPLDDPAFLQNVRETADLYDRVSVLRVERATAKAEERARKIAENEARRAQIQEERKAQRLILQKKRQAENMARRNAERKKEWDEKRAYWAARREAKGEDG